MTKSRFKEWIVLGALLALAFTFRLALTGIDRVVWGDEVMYAEAGRNLVSGNGLTYAGKPEIHHAPLFSIVTGLFSLFGGKPETPGNITFVLFGTLYLVPAYLLGRKLVGGYAARLGVLVLALLPAITSFLYFSPSMSEPMFLLLVFSFLYLCFLCLERYNLALCAAAGGTAGVAYITRPEGLLYFGVFFLVFAARKLWSKSVSWGRILKSVAVYAACFVIIATPYVCYLHAQTGRWLLSGKAGITYFHEKVVRSGGWGAGDTWHWGFDSTGTEVRGMSDERFDYSMIRDIADDPVDFAKSVGKNAISLERILLANFRLFSPVIAILLVVGLVYKPWSRERAAKEAFFALCAFPNACYLVYMVEVRYLAALFPVLVLWASRGFPVCQNWLVDTLQNISKRQLAGVTRSLTRSVPVALALIAVCAGHLPTIEQYKAQLPYEYKEVGVWLKDNLPEGAALMSRNETPAFYGEKLWVPFPNSSTEEAIRYAYIHDVDYVLVDERVVRKYRSQYLPLIEGDPPVELEPVKLWQFTNGRMMLFKLEA